MAKLNALISDEELDQEILEWTSVKRGAQARRNDLWKRLEPIERRCRDLNEMLRRTYARNRYGNVIGFEGEIREVESVVVEAIKPHGHAECPEMTCYGFAHKTVLIRDEAALEARKPLWRELETISEQWMDERKAHHAAKADVRQAEDMLKKLLKIRANRLDDANKRPQKKARKARKARI